MRTKEIKLGKEKMASKHRRIHVLTLATPALKGYWAASRKALARSPAPTFSENLGKENRSIAL